MKLSLVAALVGAPLILAGCADMMPVAPGAEPVVVAPAGAKATTPAVVVPTATVVSTDISALAGNYDVSAAACNARTAPKSRVVLSPTTVGIDGASCNITGTAREGSALRVGLACGAGQAPIASSATVKRTANGIELRYGVDAPRQLIACGK